LEQTEEKIRINLQNYESYIDYYFKSKSTDLRKKEAEKLDTEFKQSGNMLYQDEKPLVTLSGTLIKVIKKKNHLAILTDEEMVVCAAY
jgi:membrane protease subunit (stomatin/prohibitin family)